MAPTTRRARRAFAELPTDVLFDVFLLLSAMELCRLRVVCHAWRSLTSDTHFIRAHAARHQRDPLLVASFFLSGPSEEERMLIDLIDLSGKTVKRVASAMDRGQVLCPRLGLVIVANKSDNTCRVLDPAAAGAPVAPRSRPLPVLPAPSHRGSPRTGEHKVLRIFHRLKDDDRPHLFEVLTLGGGRRRGRARWRDMPSPDMFVCPDSSTVVDGVVYFLRNNVVYNGMVAALPGAGIVVPPTDSVASFDLEREEWRKRLQGPIISMGYDYDGDDSDDKLDDLNHPWCQFALAELKGCLVLMNYFYGMTHLWILTDFERGVWVKEYSILVNSIVPAYLRRLKPLFVLDDGRLVVRERVGGKLAVYDPRTDAWAWVESGPLPLGAVGIYAGSLLGLQDVW
ncbi:unnamed protein product [Miscanthus lutarioriparius]|uniref:F-box domain-containing protein n=1 Tax=Miscanthus lutarioriparius TaxID=422564 RepID=A0A811QJ68_9POAL|nr:unnamed protein product [Miscanthus lutarioriparius]